MVVTINGVEIECPDDCSVVVEGSKVKITPKKQAGGLDMEKLAEFFKNLPRPESSPYIPVHPTPMKRPREWWDPHFAPGVPHWTWQPTITYTTGTLYKTSDDIQTLT